jgi:soluble lytic murein transglycosylase-like protein
VGDRIRLYTADGMTEMAATEVVEFEKVAEPVAEAPRAAEAPVPEPPRVELSPKELVEQAAVKHGLPPEFVRLVARAESGFDPKAVSPKGAIGLMQLMPATAAQLKVDPNDPAQNAEGGVRLLRELLIRYQDHPDQLRRALAAYNAGEGAVARYGGVPPYRETQNYVHKIVEEYRKVAAPQ